MRSTVAALIVAGSLLVGCGGESDAERGAKAFAELKAANEADQPTPADAQRWIANWCDVKVTDTRGAIITRMGTPTSTTAPSASWTGFGYRFAAFFDELGVLTQLDTGADGEAQRARIKCNSVRTPDRPQGD